MGKRLGGGGGWNWGGFFCFFFVCWVVAAGCGRIALSGEGEALLAAGVVRGRSISGVARRAYDVLLDAGLANAVLLAGGDGVGRPSRHLAAIGLVLAEAELGGG